MKRHVTFSCLPWQLATEPLGAVRIFPSFGHVPLDIALTLGFLHLALNAIPKTIFCAF